MKRCWRCKLEKAASLFKKAKDKTTTLCKACARDLYKEWVGADPDRARNWRLTKRYNITLDAYGVMLTAQVSGCAICHAVWDGTGKPLYVDHCHETGVVRGLLCHKCNAGLGHFDDKPLLLARATEYLLKHGKTED